MTTIQMNQYLDSIGGLVNGWKLDAPPIKDSGFFCIGDGWLQLLHDLIEEAILLGWDKEICQVKEKFGGLRFYTNAAPKEVFDVISRYEKLSLETCETCGNPGTMHKSERGWLFTSCDICANK